MKTGVLVVEDHPITGAVYATLLGQSYRPVTLAVDFGAAVEAIADGPEVAIVDRNIPGGSGIELARRIKAALPGCRVIMVSGEAPEDYEEEAKAAGAFACLQKPVEFPKLFALLPKHPGPEAAG